MTVDDADLTRRHDTDQQNNKHTADHKPGQTASS